MEHFFPQIQVKTKKKKSSPIIFSPNSGEDQKKRASPTMEHFFPRIQVDTYAQMHTRAKLLEEMQM